MFFILNEMFGDNNPENNYDKLIDDNFKKDYPVRFGIAQNEPEDSRFELLYHQQTALYEMLAALIEMQAERHSPMDYDFSHYEKLFK